MPELPDLEYIVSILGRALPGRRIESVRVKNPVVLRLAVPGTIQEACGGQTFGRCCRHGHFLRFEVGAAHELVVNPMLAGRFRICGAGQKDEGGLCLAFRMEGGEELRYLDDKQMGKVYLVAAADRRAVPGFGAIGVEPLSEAFTEERLRALLRRRRDQVRAFLLDKSAVAAIGNAYADEILWAARLHPKTGCRGLAEEDIARLHRAIRGVLSEAVAEVARRAEPIEVKVRDFLMVRNRKGQPCPACGTTIRVEGVRGPGARLARRPLVDWTRLNRPGTN